MTKTGLVGVIERSGSKLDIRIPGTGWVLASKQSGSDWSGGVSDCRVRVAEQAIREQGIGERVIGEPVNLVTSDREFIKINNTQ